VERQVFAARFAASAEAAWAFTQLMVTEDLPMPLLFRVRLNQSYDRRAPLPGEVRFPEDSARGRALALNRCDARTAVGELWRDGRVPEWVNVAVVDETGTATIIEIVCCGRFTDDDDRLYHNAEGAPPFHVLGPALPHDHDGTPFSIHHRAECWDRSDANHLAGVADEVWSLTLTTDEFDNGALSALPDLPNVEILEHHACALGANALTAFRRFPKLRILRLRLTNPGSFRADADAATGHLTALTDLAIDNLPPQPWGHETLAAVAPALTRMRLATEETLWLGAFSPAVRNVALVAPRIAGPIRLPATLDSLTLHLSEGSAEDVAAILDGVTHVGSLGLQGTPVGDEALPLLEGRGLQHVDLVDTGLSVAGLAAFRAEHPEIGVLPREHPYDLSYVIRGDPTN
jgi:hypothetical protein